MSEHFAAQISTYVAGQLCCRQPRLGSPELTEWAHYLLAKLCLLFWVLASFTVVQSGVVTKQLSDDLSILISIAPLH